MIDIARAAHEAATVRKADADDLTRMAAVLAGAFYDDPPISWVIKDGRRRRDILESTFDLFLRKLWLAQEACYTTESVAGAVIWELPGRWKVGPLEQLRLLPAMARINGRLLPRVMRSLNMVESNHPAEPHYYLPVAGVAPEWQGRGLGTALLRPMLDRCDHERMPAYLEATTPRNRTLYERHGFAVTEEFSFGPGAPPLWRMWRSPNG
jgi:GNAT superfamily N-acetyltransferase